MLRLGKPDDVGISVTYPLPGTKLHQLVSHQLGPKQHWADSGDLTMMFPGSFSTDFYRALAHALHLEVRSPDARDLIDAAWIRVEERKEREMVKERAAS